MHDTAPDPEGGREGEQEDGRAANSEPDPSSPPPPSGFTRFLVEGPSAAGISRETLIEAVRSLHREREYLRRARDLQLADFQVESTSQREHAEELEERLQRVSQAAEAQAEDLKREVAALRDEMEKLIANRDAILADRDVILADRDAIDADRDAWRARAKRSLPARLRQKLLDLARRLRRSSRKTESSTQPSHTDDRTDGA